MFCGNMHVLSMAMNKSCIIPRSPITIDMTVISSSIIFQLQSVNHILLFSPIVLHQFSCLQILPKTINHIFFFFIMVMTGVFYTLSTYQFEFWNPTKFWSCFSNFFRHLVLLLLCFYLSRNNTVVRTNKNSQTLLVFRNSSNVLRCNVPNKMVHIALYSYFLVNSQLIFIILAKVLIITGMILQDLFYNLCIWIVQSLCIVTFFSILSAWLCCLWRLPHLKELIWGRLAVKKYKIFL